MQNLRYCIAGDRSRTISQQEPSQSFDGAFGNSMADLKPSELEGGEFQSGELKELIEHWIQVIDGWVQDLVDEPPRVDPSDGCFPLPDRPGLGLRLDHDACAAHPRTGGRLQLFEAGWERRGFGGAKTGGKRRS